MTNHTYDAIVIGGGHNGLVAGAYLARAGKKTLILEKRHLVGGASVTEEVRHYVAVGPQDYQMIRHRVKELGLQNKELL